MQLTKGSLVLAPDRYNMVKRPDASGERPALVVMEVLFVSPNLHTWVTLTNGKYTQTAWAEDLKVAPCGEIGAVYNPYTLERI